MNRQLSDLEQIVAQLLDGYSVEKVLDVLFERCRIRIRSNSVELIERLGHYYKPFVSAHVKPHITIDVLDGAAPKLPLDFEVRDPGPNKKRIKEEFVDLEGGRIVRKRLTQMHFLFGSELNVVVGPCLQNDNQVINFVNNRYIETRLREGLVMLHAAGVCNDHAGLALAGFSGMGKSTLALHLMSAGLTFVSNDRLLIERRPGNLLMHGVPKQPRVNPGTLMNNPDLRSILPDDQRHNLQTIDSDELWQLEDKYDVDIERHYGPDRQRLAGPMSALVILNWTTGATPTNVRRVDLRTRQDLLVAFMKSPGLFYHQQRRSDPSAEQIPETYLKLLDEHPVYEIIGNIDFKSAVSSCRKLLNLRSRLSC